MFEISDDDLLWNDDFSLEEIEAEENSKLANESRPLKLESFQARDSEQLRAVKEQYKHLTNSKVAVLQHKSRSPQEQKSVNTDVEQTDHSGRGILDHNTNKNSKLVVSTEELVKGCKRKFPGPAGILPPYSAHAGQNTTTLPTSDAIAQTGSPANVGLKHQPHSIPWSQGPADDVFMSPQWKAVVSDLGQDAEVLLAKFSIRSMLLKASRNLLHKRKVPLIIGVMESLDMQGSDASFVIRDPSGKMTGALHRDLFKDPLTALQAGSVLVLRQVSVISPSSRTHYLNVTPGNVALIYTANKEAMILKRPWSFFESCHSSVTKLDTKDAEVLLLNQIIKDSEQELTESVGRFHQGLEGSYQSPSTSLRAGTSVVSSRFNRNVLSPLPLVSSAPRCPSTLGTPRNNMTHSMPGISPRGSLFRSNHQSLALFPRARASKDYGTSHSSVRTIGSYKKPPHVIMPCNPSLPLQNSVLSGSKAVQGISAMDFCSGISASDIQKLRQGDLEMMPEASRGLQLRTCAGENSRAFRAALGKNKNCDETEGDLTTFSDDFPDNDDHVMLQMCDGILGQVTDESSDGQTVISVNRQEETSKENKDSRSVATSSSIVNRVFEDCRQENKRIGNSFRAVNIYEADSELSDTRTAFKLATDNSLTSSSTTLNEKKFTFRRSDRSLSASPAALPAKHPVYDSHNQNIGASMDEPNLSRIKMSLMSQENCDNNLNVLFTDKSSTVFPVPVAVRTAQPALHVTVPIRSATVVDDKSAAPRVNSAVSSPHFSTFSGTGAPAGSRTLFELNKDPERDSKIRLGKRDFDSMEGRQVNETVRMFPQWDDDLNDDQILSQLSDEF